MKSIDAAEQVKNDLEPHSARSLRHSMVVPKADDGGRRSHREADLLEIRSSEIVGELVRYVGRIAPPVTVVQGPISGPGSFVGGGSEEGDLLLSLDDADFVAGDVATLRFAVHGVEFRLDGSLQRAIPHGWRLSLPRLFCLDQRAAERLTLDWGVATLRWSEVQGGALVRASASVEQLSSEGVGVSLAPGASVPTEAPFAASLEIDGQHIDCLAETRHLANAATSTRCGIKLHARSRRDDLVDAYLRHRFPQLLRRRDVDPDRVYGLLETSGYLALRADMKPPRNWFARSDDDAISRDVCFRADDGELIGHVSFTRAYPRAWLGHQLATIRKHDEATACRRAIYLHIATYPTLIDGDDAMMVGYYDRGRPWHQRFFTGFVDWLRDPSLAVAYSLDRFERTTTDRPTQIAIDGIEIGSPRPEELAPAAALVRAHLPPLVSAALDIHPEKLSCSMLNDNYAKTRYERGRQALVLRVRGELAGVALCETGSRELSIFNLFNMAQFFVLSGVDPRAQLALLGAVRAFYQARGERNPMIVAPPGSFDASGEKGTVLAETMGMIIWSGRALRQYENFIKYQFGRQLEAVA